MASFAVSTSTLSGLLSGTFYLQFTRGTSTGGAYAIFPGYISSSGGFASGVATAFIASVNLGYMGIPVTLQTYTNAANAKIMRLKIYTDAAGLDTLGKYANLQFTAVKQVTTVSTQSDEPALRWLTEEEVRNIESNQETA